jgi:O-antigen ligase
LIAHGRRTGAIRTKDLQVSATLPTLDRSSADLSWRLSAPALAAAVLLSPFIAWRPADILFTASDFFFVIGAGLLVAANRLPIAPLNPLTPFSLLAVAALLSGLLLGSFVNGDPTRWLIAAAQYSFTFILLPMLLAGQGASRVLLLTRSLIAGMVLLELFGIAVYLFAEPSYQSYTRFGSNFITGGGRLSSFLGNANWNGCMIAMTLPLVLFLRVRGLMRLPAFLFVMAVLLSALVLSASVTGLSSAVLASVIFFAVGRVRVSMKMLGLVATVWVALVAFGFSAPAAFEKRVGNAVETGDVHSAGTFTDRAELMVEAWDIVEETSLVGLGVDQYRKVSAMGAPVHNMYLLVWAEGGLLALLGWLGLIALYGAIALSAWRIDPLAASLGLSVLAVFIVFSNASPHMYARLWAVPLLLALAQPLASVARAREAARGRKITPPPGSPQGKPRILAQ